MTEELSYYATLSSRDLFRALAAVGDPAARRATTARVYAERLAGWEQLPAFATTEASHLVKDIHLMFRRGFQQVLLASEKESSTDSDGMLSNKGKWVGSFVSYNDMLHHHHSIEDQWWFPRMCAIHPEIADEVRVLESDHKKLVTLEDRITNHSDRDALKEFITLLEDHLNREEMLTVPFLLDGSSGM
jgi:hemerythrin superfamily protein